MRTLSTHPMFTAWLLCTAVLTIYPPQDAVAQDQARSGKALVEAFCAACHGTGAEGAPRIGDADAWSARASQGLTALTRHALDGIRRMPAHGGQPQLTDLEIARAVTYMVNESGGNWVEPTSRSELMAERTGPEVVETHCAACHREGVGGAPRIGDMNAWVLRLRQGLPYAVHSAIRGHGGMPPRGGAADLTDAEIRNAILYMFNPQPAIAPASTRAGETSRAAPADANHVNVGGMDIYVGFVSTERLRAYPPGSPERSMHRGIPGGDDWYHVNVSLLDESSRAPVTDAMVDVRIDEFGAAAVSKGLEPMAIGEGSYGNYFRMKPKTPYRITVRVRTPQSPRPVEAEFRHEHN